MAQAVANITERFTQETEVCKWKSNIYGIYHYSYIDLPSGGWAVNILSLRISPKSIDLIMHIKTHC